MLGWLHLAEHLIVCTVSLAMPAASILQERRNEDVEGLLGQKSIVYASQYSLDAA